MTGGGLLRRNRDFRLLWSGQVVSVFGSQLSLLAYPLLVLAMTSSAERAGAIGAVATVPYSLAQIPAGVLVDRWDRRRIMLGCDAGRLVALGSIPLAGLLWRVTYPQLLVVAFVEGTLFVAFNLAERAGIPAVVSPNDLSSAVAQNEAKSQGANLAGPAVAGILFGVARLLPFLADAVSYAVSLVTVTLLHSNLGTTRPGPGTTPPGPGTTPPGPGTTRPGPGTSRSVRRDLREGFTWMWKQPFFRAGAVLVAGVNPVLVAVSLTIIVIVRGDGASPRVIGLVMACGGAGGLLGAMAAPRLLRHISPNTVVTVGTWVWAALLALMAVFRAPVELAALVATVFFVGPLWNVAMQTTRARLIPNHMLGRASSVTLLIAWSTLPVGSLLGGFALQSIGGAGTMRILAALMAAIALAAGLSPSLRRGPDASAPPTAKGRGKGIGMTPRPAEGP
jgi:MFS family permease